MAKKRSTKREDVHVVLNGHPYRIKFARLPPNVWGECEPPAGHGEESTITIAQTLKGKELLDTLIHEAVHAISHQVLSEEIVSVIGTDVGAMLYDVFGYREEAP